MTTLSKSQNEDPSTDSLPPDEPLEKKYRLFAVKENRIDMKFIMKTSLDSNVMLTISEEEKIDKIITLKVVHLEWLNIKRIENLDIFTHLETLYLQYNNIEKIENLDMLISLEYLALNNNRINRIENLKHMKNLVFLNLSNNQIEEFDEQELPEGLEMLKCIGNPCADRTDYMKKVFTRLPDLLELDGNTVSKVMKLVAAGKLPAHMLEYAREAEEINLKSEKVTKRESSTENNSSKLTEEVKLNKRGGDVISDNDEDEDGNEQVDNEEAEDEEEEEDEDDEEGENEESAAERVPSRGGLGTSESYRAVSDVSTAYSRADESMFSQTDLRAENPDIGILREKTERILKRMKERYGQQLGDTMQEIEESLALNKEIIKIYKNAGKK